MRVCSVDLERAPVEPEVLARLAHRPVRDAGGTLRWDWSRITGFVRESLQRALADGPAASIGVDTWGVDYGLLDADGELLAPPVSYRDGRTRNWTEVTDRIGADVLYRTTGIQLMAINTIFQLAAHERAELRRARRLLMLPELVVHALTGAACAEMTSAGTTALVDLGSRTWSAKLLDAIDVEPGLFAPIRPPGTRCGTFRGVPVHLVAGHDTASAVATVPDARDGLTAFISTGSWFLVGAVRPAPDLSPAAREANFSNEPAADGAVRLLKNIPGLAILEQCRRAWGEPPMAQLAAEAATRPPAPIIDPAAGQLADVADHDVETSIRHLARLTETATRADVVRCVLDSLAAAAARVLDELGLLIGQPVTRLHMLGGGTRLPLLAQLISQACLADVTLGPAEATAIGNALVQGVAIGRFADLAQARETIGVCA